MPNQDWRPSVPDSPRIKIAPSILSADFSRLGEQVSEAEKGGADMIHVDIMDGHFVPNITMGPMVVGAIRHWTDLPFDLHLMIANPDRYIPLFVEAGADIISVHAEACTHLHRVVYQIKEAGKKASVAINPGTPISAIEELLADLDQVLVMTVNPGFGGQSFIESMLSKIKRVRSLLDERGLHTDLEVDGGVNIRTVSKAAQAGANVLVAGSAVYNRETTVAEAIARVRESIG
jgi:ribulose-phosphate 3-epimerase